MKGLQISSRKKEILNSFVDAATGHAYRDAEAEAASIFEDATGTTFRATLKTEAGDFVATTGKYARKTFDHLGIPKEALSSFKMSEFKKSITSHFNKSVDFILLDVRFFNKAQKTEIFEYIDKTHLKDINRLITLE